MLAGSDLEQRRGRQDLSLADGSRRLTSSGGCTSSRDHLLLQGVGDLPGGRAASPNSVLSVRRTYYVVEVTDAQCRRLLDSPRTQDGGLFDLGDARLVSNRARRTRTADPPSS
ncbi:hypothetical protein [Dactylosporangium sp. CA-233914]|uniref:hypothetical protein n=1 Tax=Dactylosporangium sp. CA-233914 TaxID=3239934 RepID=UPI003D8FABBE